MTIFKRTRTSKTGKKIVETVNNKKSPTGAGSSPIKKYLGQRHPKGANSEMVYGITHPTSEHDEYSMKKLLKEHGVNLHSDNTYSHENGNSVEIAKGAVTGGKHSVNVYIKAKRRHVTETKSLGPMYD
jgi:hypothetical protein